MINRENVMAEYYFNMLKEIGEDTEREGLKKTPRRAAKAMLYLTEGYNMNIDDIVNGAIFIEESNNMVVVKDIEFYSMCEHHMLPFWGVCHIAYIPNGKIIGLSKLARIVDMFAKRLQVQERLTEEIALAIQKVIDAKGVAVVIKAQHMCMMMRGVEKRDSKTVTSTRIGEFADNERLREEFQNLLIL